MEKNPKRMLDNFQTQLQLSWEEYRFRHNIKDTKDALITYLIDFQIIKHTTIRKFTIQREFEHSSIDTHTNKTTIVKNLGNKYNLTTRAVWNLIKEK